MDVAKLAPITRIVLRYGAGILVTKGILDAESTSLFADPELVDLVQIGVGVAVAAGTEVWYWIATKFGWKK